MIAATVEARHRLHAEILKLETRLKPGEKWNANAFAEKISVAPFTAQRLLSGQTKSISASTAIKIADAFGEPREKWLDIGGHDPLVEGSRFVRGLVRVEVLGTVPGGPESDGAFDEAELIEVPSDFARKGDMFLRVRGKSMEPVLPDGAIIAVKKTHAVPDGSMVVARLRGGEHTVKWFSARKDGPYLVAENPAVCKAFPLGDGEIIGIPIAWGRFDVHQITEKRKR